MSRQRSISIIDSDPNSRLALQQNVTAAGFPAEAFSSVEDFDFNARLSAAGCVVADLTMTGLQGIDLKRLLQAAELDIPVIYLTACDTHEVRAAAREVGAAGCFSKPLDMQKLLDTIEKALTTSRRRWCQPTNAKAAMQLHRRSSKTARASVRIFPACSPTSALFSAILYVARPRMRSGCDSPFSSSPVFSSASGIVIAAAFQCLSYPALFIPAAFTAVDALVYETYLLRSSRNTCPRAAANPTLTLSCHSPDAELKHNLHWHTVKNPHGHP